MSVHTIAPAWQHPYVNVFKLCEVDQLKDVLVQGDVTEAMDRIIGKKVFKLRGTIPANNFLQVPKRRSTSLGLNGPFLYIQFKASPVKVFIIHVDLLTHDGNVHRVSISNMYSPDSIKRKSSGIQIPFPSPSHRWCVLALDMVAVLAGFSASPFASLRSLTLCSWLIVRSIYTSELKFSLQNLPRDMALSHALDTSVFEMHWLPSEPPMPDAQIMPVKPMGAAPVSSPESPRPTSPRAPRVHTGPPIVSSQFDAVPPAMTLERINNFTGEFTQVLAWAPGGRDELVFAAASTAIAMRADGSTQRFFFGHTAHVAGLAFDAAGGIMATIQEGKQAVVRVWDFDTGACAAVLNAHASGLVCVSVSPDGRALAAVGQDAHNRQTIVVWDISKLRLGGMAEVVTRHTTDFNVRVLRFSEFEEDQLVAAGRDSIRFYRLKAGQLRGVSVRLSAPGRRVTSYAGGISAAPGPNIFTDVAFECGGGMLASDVRRVFVSSASGAVFEINCNTRELLCIYQLHPSAINSISVTDSFCVTAGDDALMRVWPLDFSDYLLEAAHEGPVTSCGVSADGLTVCIGTEGGALGVLHIPSQAYRTLLRSHTAAVHAVAADPNRPHYVTAGADSTIRMWDVNTHEQLLEFDAPGEVVTSVAYHPTHHEIACGFGNGRTRVFDIGATTLVKEHSQHKGEVTQLLYSPDGWWLYSAGNDGGLCVYDVAQVYAPIKFLSAGGKHAKMCVAVSADGRYVATTSRDAHTGVTSLLLFHGDSLEPYMRIETDADAFTKLAFSSDAAELWALAQPSRLDRFELTEGRRVQSAGNPHRLDALVLASDPCGAFMVTAGLDQHVKLWGVSSGVAMALERGAPSAEDFIGHPAPVYGAAFLGADRLITVGDACSVMVWRLARGGDAGRQGVGSSRSQAWEKAKAQQHPSAAAAGGGAAGGSGRASWEGAQTQRHPSATAAAAAAAAAAQQRRGSGNPAAAPPDGMPPLSSIKQEM
ncbi:hypothetical protein FOA52_014450 [Chlamydomonas sp. UWO 241]|nr:hypothetical protein FOA52_014450 [Chlamydomonas sp. UWO 241]